MHGIGMGRKLLNALGSLKLACVLLGAVALILAVATFYESNTGTQSALLNIYRTIWFNGLLGLLAINVAAAALIRWPWQKRQVGFVITHVGIIVLLGGCSAAFHYGTEGIIALHVGESPANEIRVDDEVLTAIVPNSELHAKALLRFKHNGAVRPRQLRLSNDLWLTLDEHAGNSRAEQTIAAGNPTPNPALRFTIESAQAQQHLSDWVLANSPEQNQINLGPAVLRFITLDDAEQIRQLTNAVADATPPQLGITIAGQTYTIDPSATGKEFPLGTTGVQAIPGGYWPDFRLGTSNTPMSVTEEPNNPAAIVTLRQADNQTRHAFVFAKPGLPPMVTGATNLEAQLTLRAGTAVRGSGITLGLASDGRVFYAAKAKAGFTAGIAELGKAFEPGWMDFKITVNEVITNAIVTEQIVPAPETSESSTPALKVTAHAGNDTQTAWLRADQPSFLHVGDRMMHLFLGNDTLVLPFTVQLEKFEVEHDEGSDNVAGWKAHVIFEDATGKQEKAVISMNHPAQFNGFKFAQASWNPDDLNFTVLQVKKDPVFVTWLTWFGSGLIVLGTALLFYFRRLFVNQNPTVNI